MHRTSCFTLEIKRVRCYEANVKRLAWATIGQPPALTIFCMSACAVLQCIRLRHLYTEDCGSWWCPVIAAECYENTGSSSQVTLVQFPATSSLSFPLFHLIRSKSLHSYASINNAFTDVCSAGFKDAVNQSVVTRLIKEVRSMNPSFQASHIRGEFIFSS